MREPTIQGEEREWLQVAIVDYPRGTGKGSKAAKTAFKKKVSDEFYSRFPLVRGADEDEAAFNERRVLKDQVRKSYSTICSSRLSWSLILCV